MQPTLGWFQFVAFLIALNVARAEVRLAILPTDAEASAPADLLIASLAGVTNASLVERTEVDRISREQNLFSATTPDFARVGQLLRADGLVLLQPLATQTKTNLAVRLVAIKSGVVLDAALFPLPLKDATQWGELLSKRLAPLLPKLSVERTAAVPISFLNLRAAVSAPASAQTERSLSALLYHRLMQERELFVLERREMGRLEWEKNLAGPDAGEFWNGSYLLEGVIDRDGTGPDMVTIHARLVPPSQGTGVDIAASGPRRNLVEVTERLAVKILAVLHRAPSVTAWSPDTEAARYQEEASWALRWGMWPEAKAAAESAFSLGRRTEEVSGIKVRALLEQARTSEALVFDPIRGTGWATNAPTPKILPNAQEALQTYFAHCVSVPTNRWRTNGPWIELGLEALETSARVSRHHYFFGWRQDQYDSALPELREAARQVATLLSTDSERATPYPSGPVFFDERYPVSSHASTYEELLGRFGCWWQETPSHTIRLYRELMESGGYARNRPAILLRLWNEPMWVAWSRGDRVQGELEWKSFLLSLQTSTNQTVRAEGALLAMQAARFSPELNEAAAAFCDATTDETHLRFTTSVNFKLLDAYGEMLRLKQSQARTLLRTKLLENWDQSAFARQKHFLQTAATHDVDRAGSPIARAQYTPAQARELLPVLEDYAKRFPGGDWLRQALDNVRQRTKADSDELTEFFASTHHNPDEFKRLFGARAFTKQEAASLLPRLEGYSRNVSFPEDVAELKRQLRAQIASAPTPLDPANQALHVTRVWLPKVNEQGFQKLFAEPFTGIVDGGSSLIAAVPYSRGHGLEDRRCAIVELDIGTGGFRELAREIPAPGMLTLPLQATKTRVFWIQDSETIGWVDRRTVRKSQFKPELAIPVGAQLVVADERVFLVSGEYIAELQPEKGTTKLLVSARRNPPLNKLDSVWQKQGGGRLFSASNGMLAAAFGPKLWLQDPKTEDWNEVPQTPTNAVGCRIVNNKLLISVRETLSEFGTRPDHFMWPDREALFSYGPTTDGKLGLQTLLSMDERLLPRWAALLNRIFEPGQMTQKAWDGTNLWILLPPSERITDATSSRVVQLHDRNGTLVWFDPRWEMPVEIPLWFTNSAVLNPFPYGAQLLPVAKGLVVLANKTVGQTQERWFPDLLPFGREFTSIWIIPETDLRRWVQTHQQESQKMPRREPEMRQHFDRNADGQMDADELKTMQNDTNWLASIREWNARRLLCTFDADGDGKLAGPELDKLAMANLKVYRTIYPAPYPIGTPKFMLQRFDEDKDDALKQIELVNLLADSDGSRPRQGPTPGFGRGGPPNRPGFPNSPFARSNAPPVLPQSAK